MIKFSNHISLERREEIIKDLTLHPDKLWRLARELLFENYFGIKDGYKITICTN